MTDPTPLSQAAQAVLDAIDFYEMSGPQQIVACAHAAAALRAAANEFRSEMESSLSNDFVRGVLATAKALEEIAAELEGAND